MNEDNLIKYYNKFNEEKRLERRHGIVEFTTTMHYIKEVLKNKDNAKILDVGAGAGKYSITLNEMGYDVTAIELVKHNLKKIQNVNKDIKSYQGNALDLSRFPDNSFDLVLVFGPLYHLISHDDKVRALNEAKRVLKDDGVIMVQYVMNDYAIMKHGFIDGNILKSIENKNIDNDYQVLSNDTDLYSYVRLDEIDKLNYECKLERIKRVTPDGLTDLFRKEINSMDEDTFSCYLKYHLTVCERIEMLGYSSHVLDIVKKN